jgi:hypothetical protein
VKGDVELPSVFGPGDIWKVKLYWDAEFKNGLLKYWTLKANSTSQKIDVQSSWAVTTGGKAYIQGLLKLNGELYTIRLMTQETGTNNGLVSIQLWKGQADGPAPDFELLNAVFKGTINIE